MTHETPGSSSSPPSTLVRVATGHVVSSSSMVSRAFLADTWRGIVVAGSDGDHWLASTLDALAPDEQGLLIRGEEDAGLPRAYAKATLTKIVMTWGAVDDMAEITLANPRVVQHPGGAPIGVVSLERSGEFASHIEAGTDPSCHGLAGVDSAVAACEVETLLDSGGGSYWPVSRQAWPSPISGSSFLDQPGAVALDVALAREDSGSPVFGGGKAGRVLHGVVRPVAANVAMLLPTHLIAETVAHARADDGLS